MGCVSWGGEVEDNVPAPGASSGRTVGPDTRQGVLEEREQLCKDQEDKVTNTSSLRGRAGPRHLDSRRGTLPGTTAPWQDAGQGPAAHACPLASTSREASC